MQGKDTRRKVKSKGPRKYGPRKLRQLYQSVDMPRAVDGTSDDITAVRGLDTPLKIQGMEQGPVTLINYPGTSTVETFEDSRVSGIAAYAHSVSWIMPTVKTVKRNEVDSEGATVEKTVTVADARGQYQKADSIHVRFENKRSEDDVILHANTPMTRSPGSSNVDTRVFGLRQKGKVVPVATLKPGQSIDYHIDMDKFDHLFPITEKGASPDPNAPEAETTVPEGQTIVNLIQFAVCRPNSTHTKTDTSPTTVRDVGSYLSYQVTVKYSKMPLHMLNTIDNNQNSVEVEAVPQPLVHGKLTAATQMYEVSAVDFSSAVREASDRISADAKVVKVRMDQGKAVLYSKCQDGTWEPFEVEGIPEWMTVSIPALSVRAGKRFSSCVYKQHMGQWVLWKAASDEPWMIAETDIDSDEITLQRLAFAIGSVSVIPGTKRINWGNLIERILARLIDLVFDAL